MKTTTICFLVSGDGVYLSEKKRGFGHRYLNGYGGKVAEGESVEAAAARELNEEAGVAVAPEKLEKVALIDFFEGEEHLFACHVFLASAWEGEFKESEEMARPEWHPRSRFPYERMWKSDRVWLPLVFSGERIRARAYYRKGMDEMERFEHEPLS